MSVLSAALVKAIHGTVGDRPRTRKGIGRMARFEGVTDATRAVMRANRGKDTKPEMTVRRLAHAMGYRYRLHGKGLPGRPDLVFGPRRKVVLVHGCFWHAHEGCPKATRPRTRTEFWDAKFARNRDRDGKVAAALRSAGWDVLVLWECALSDRAALAGALASFLGPSGPVARRRC